MEEFGVELVFRCSWLDFDLECGHVASGCVVVGAAPGWGGDFGVLVCYLVDCEEDGVFPGLVVFERAVDDVFDCRAAEGWKALFSLRVSVVMDVCVPDDHVEGELVECVVVADVGVRAGGGGWLQGVFRRLVRIGWSGFRGG